MKWQALQPGTVKCKAQGLSLRTEERLDTGFRCPQCDAANSLSIVASIELPSDSRSDEIAVQLVTCARCAFSGAAVYEESRRGSLDGEAWDHIGYVLTSDAYLEVSRLVLSCPNPGDGNCPCDAHRILGSTDETGRWVGLNAYSPRTYFSMQ
jgi:transcription elongation factor Elf1